METHSSRCILEAHGAAGLLGERRGSFIVKSSKWFAAPENPGEENWRDARQLLEDEHRNLLQAVADPRNSRAVAKSEGMLLQQSAWRNGLDQVQTVRVAEIVRIDTQGERQADWVIA